MYLLDLYQKAMDEKDALALEVKGLSSALSQEQGALEALTKERDALIAKVQQLQGDNERVAVENADLAARLTTAQIRRLEAEKILLEAQIEWQRAQTAEADALRKGRAPASAQRAPAATGSQSATSSHPLKRAAEEASSTSTNSTDSHATGNKP
jgi:regulator of replication initiation timing